MKAFYKTMYYSRRDLSYPSDTPTHEELYLLCHHIFIVTTSTVCQILFLS